MLFGTTILPIFTSIILWSLPLSSHGTEIHSEDASMTDWKRIWLTSLNVVRQCSPISLCHKPVLQLSVVPTASLAREGHVVMARTVHEWTISSLHTIPVSALLFMVVMVSN